MVIWFLTLVVALFRTEATRKYSAARKQLKFPWTQNTHLRFTTK